MPYLDVIDDDRFVELAAHISFIATNPYTSKGDETKHRKQASKPSSARIVSGTIEHLAPVSMRAPVTIAPLSCT